MQKADILKALDALKKEVEKKPEDKVLEKLEEILRAVKETSHVHVCQPCYLPHYPCTKPHYPQWGYYYGAYTQQGNLSLLQTGTTNVLPNNIQYLGNANPNVTGGND